MHYGSLSKSEREETEEALKSTKATATFCSSTLEMGIDVGNVKLVGQIGPAWSVSSLSQRLGRSGRKEGESSIIRIYIEEDEPEQDTSLFYRLFLGLLQATAMTRLMLEKWCEPPEVDRFHLSTLIQQVLSVIKERGGARADSLHRTLVLEGGFPAVDRHTLARLLRCMGTADLIEQTSEGLLITGLRGEKIIAHHSFYVAFVVEEEYRVTHAGHHIGNVGFVPELEEEGFLILAGRRWKVLNIDHDRKTILVEPSTGGRVPRFFSGPGGDIHPRVRAVMRELLEQDDFPVYLDPTAREMLAQARATARDSGLFAIRSCKTASTRSGSPGRVRGSSAPFRRSENSPACPKSTTRTSPWCSRKPPSTACKRSTAASFPTAPTRSHWPGNSPTASSRNLNAFSRMT